MKGITSEMVKIWAVCKRRMTKKLPHSWAKKCKLKEIFGIF